MWLPEHSLQPLLGTSPLLSLEQLFSLTTDTQPHAHTLLCTDTQDANTHVCTYRHTHSRTGTYRYTQAHKYTHIHIQMHTGKVGTSTHMPTQRYTHAQQAGAHVHSQVHTCTQCTHRYTHRHTLTPPCTQLLPKDQVTI